MEEFRADLHCHTTCSDGTLTPKEIIQMAHKIGLRGLSITDHDTIMAYDEALTVAKALQLPVISGVEFSAIYQNIHIHILGYSFSLTSPLIQEFCQQHFYRRIKRNNMIINLLNSHGMPILNEDLPADQYHHSIGRPHIALAMVKKGYAKSIQEAFNRFIGEGKPYYVPGDMFSVEETIDKIHEANGLAVIAHPHLIEKTHILKDLLNMNFDGIEGYYARFPRKAHERWVKIGARKGWIITGGSDFHGDFKPDLPLGSSWVNEETFKVLHQHYQRNQ